MSVLLAIREYTDQLMSNQFAPGAVAVLLCSLVTAFLLFRYFYGNTLHGVPTVPSNSVLGFKTPFASFQGNSHRVMLALTERLGSVFQFHFLGQHCVAINDRFAAKEVLQTVTGKGYPLHGGNPSLNVPSMFSLDTGAEWSTRRQTFRAGFSASALKKHTGYVKELVVKVGNILEDAANQDEIVEVDKLFGQLTIDVICSVAFQMNVDAIGNSNVFQEAHDSLRVLFESSWIALLPVGYFIWPLLYLVPIPAFSRYVNAKRFMQDFCKIIWHHIQQEHREGRLLPDSLGESFVILSEQPNITELDILQEINLIFVAGHETTAHTLSWFLYALARNPEVQQKCQQAISIESMNCSTLRDEPQQPLPPFVEAVLKESMRRYPTASSGSIRRVKKPEGCTLTIGGALDPADPTAVPQQITVKQGSWIVINFFALHNSEANWGPNPLAFRPERWLAHAKRGNSGVASDTEDDLDESKEETLWPAADPRAPSLKNKRLASHAIYSGGGAKSKELTFCPFSFGKRNCIGQNLALMEIRMAIRELIAHFEFELADQAHLDENIALETYFTLRPNKKLPLRVRKWSQ